MATFRASILISVLRAGQEAAYEAAHARIPGDLAEALTAAGVRDWGIWRDGRTLLHLVDVDDYEAMAARLDGNVVNDRWQVEMAEFVEQFEEVTTIPIILAPRLVWSMSRQFPVAADQE